MSFIAKIVQGENLKIFSRNVKFLTLFKIDLFVTTQSEKLIPYLKKIQKIYKSRDKPFFQSLVNFTKSRNFS